MNRFERRAENILSKIDGWTYPKKRDILAKEVEDIFISGKLAQKVAEAHKRVKTYERKKR